MKKKYIHFVGIKGVGMTPLAVIAKEAGFKVTGSDIDQEFITDEALKKAGIIPFKGFSDENIKKPDLVITTGAHNGFDNIEVKKAKEKGIAVMSTGEALAYFMDGKVFDKKFKKIAVAGTHGKTTTTGMIATIFKENKLDPTFVIGTGNVGSLGSPGHFGHGNVFVAEADEYAIEPKYDKRPKFLLQKPDIAVITNIEFDHPDIFEDIDDVRNNFLKFAGNISEKGILVANGDDRQTKKMLSEYTGKSVTFGFNPDNNYVIKKLSISGERMFFWVEAYGKSLGEFMLNVAGEHNALNGLAAFIVAVESGLTVDKIKTGLAAFKGSKRRLEYIGELYSGAKAYDDYAHHPTEISKTLAGLKKQYPDKKIVCIFQPHTYSRTKNLFGDFAKSFADCYEIILADIYASAREPADPTVNSELLSQEIAKNHKNIKYKGKLQDISDYINNNFYRSDSVVVTMGAGDIYKIHSLLKMRS